MIFMSCVNDSGQGGIVANSKDLQVGLLPYNDLWYTGDVLAVLPGKRNLSSQA